MIAAFNALLECLVTGLFTALFVILGIRLGWIPLVGFEIMDKKENPYDE